MTIQTINVGSYANDGTGDYLRAAGSKINSNFEQLDSRDEYDAEASFPSGTVRHELQRLGLVVNSSHVSVAYSGLADLDPQAGRVAYVPTNGRAGFFACMAGSAPSDPLGGIFVASTTDGFYWSRIWDGIHGRPEWFGAVVGGADCAAAINACITLCPVTLLQAADYWISSTVKVNKSNRKLRGVGQNYVSASGEATRILTTSASITLVQVGDDAFGGSVNSMIRGCTLEDVYIGRTTGPSISAAPAGVLIQYVIGAEVSRVKSVDSIHSFRFNGTVACYATRCNANRILEGSGVGVDSWTGYWVDGSASIGLAGGNGSVYIDQCQAGCNISSLQTGLSYGYRLTAGFQDTFLLNVESVSCNIGISIEGGSGANADVVITGPIMDAVFKWGIYVAALATTGTINITDPYVGANSSTAFCLYFNNTAGAVNVQGGQLVCSSGSSLTSSISIDGTVGSAGVVIDGTIISECATNAVTIGDTGTTCSNIRLQPIVSSALAVTAAAAVKIAGTLRASYLAPIVKGRSDAFGYGIQVVGAGDARNEYNMTGVDSSCILAGSSNKLIRNGVPVTSTGATGTNLVSGVMA